MEYGHYHHHHHHYEQQQRTMRIFPMEDESLCLSVRKGEVVLASANPRDEYQHWFKDTRYSTALKDQEGFPSFALVNIATGQAIKHSIRARLPVRLVPHDPDNMDQSVLWTESNDTGEGFRRIRMVTNTFLGFDAFRGDTCQVNLGDGTKVVVWDMVGGMNQRWKIIPWYVFPRSNNMSLTCCCCSNMRLPGWERQPTVRIFTKADENYSLTIRDGNVILAPTNPRDELQHWIKDMRYSTTAKDEQGLLSFALVNKATGQAIKHPIGATHPVRLVRYKPDYLDETVLWTESNDTCDGFRWIKMVNNIHLNLDAFDADIHGKVRDGTIVGLWECLQGKNQRWKIVPYN